MFHYVHQLVTNRLCLLSGAEHVSYSSFLELFSSESSCYRHFESTDSMPKQ